MKELSKIMPELSYLILHDDPREVQNLDYQHSGTFTPHDVLKLVTILEGKGHFKLIRLFKKSSIVEEPSLGLSEKML